MQSGEPSDKALAARGGDGDRGSRAVRSVVTAVDPAMRKNTVAIPNGSVGSVGGVSRPV